MLMTGRVSYQLFDGSHICLDPHISLNLFSVSIWEPKIYTVLEQLFWIVVATLSP